MCILYLNYSKQVKINQINMEKSLRSLFQPIIIAYNAHTCGGQGKAMRVISVG